MNIREYSENLTATGVGQTVNTQYGPHSCETHVWQVINNAGTSAVVRPEGSIVGDRDALASTMWAELGSSDTTITTGACSIITIPNTPLRRARLNVKTLASASVDVRYLGYMAGQQG